MEYKLSASSIHRSYNLFHLLILNQISEDNFRKRVKLNSGSAVERAIPENVTVIADTTDHILPINTPGVALFSGTKIQYYNAQSNTLENKSIYNPLDINITHQQFSNQLNPCLTKFFSIPSLLIHGLLVFGTKEGSVYIRNLGADPLEDVKILTFEGSEQLQFVDVLNIPALSDDHNTIIAFGNRGTIMTYSRASNNPTETIVSFNQFNIQGSIVSIDKVSKNPSYLIASSLGHVNRLDFKSTIDGIEMEFNMVIPTYNGVKNIRVFDPESNVFDSICEHDGTAYFRSKCEYKLVSQSNDSQEIKQAIEQALAQLEASEAEIKQMDEDEQALNKKLVSVNKTLYALRSINSKRKRGVINSLESTGFEFSMRPITLKQSIANSSLHCSSYLRVSIKTSRFLELEDWDLQLDFFSKKSSTSGQTKSVSVMGFEPHFENGIERYSIWERDIEIDLNILTLPVEVSATLIMSANEAEVSPLLFPVSCMVVDDLHFAVPCTPDFISSIERRGLEDISNRLMESFNKQKLHDKTGKYPFARLLNSKKQMTSPERLFDYREIHIRCNVDIHMTNDSYRSILPRLLDEGRTMEDMKSIFVNAEQALFTLAAFPGCPVIIKLARVSSTLIDICVQCVYLTVLFKVEATLLRRLYQGFIEPSVSDKQDNKFMKRLKSLEDAIIDVQDKYQNEKDQMDVDGSSTITERLKNAVDVLYSIHGEYPIGHLHADSSGNE